jgi:hypothetical protein
MSTEQDPTPIPVGDIAGPVSALCWAQNSHMVRCDRKQGHLGPHSWELPQWRPIETAPRDGTSLLLYDCGASIGRFEAYSAYEGAWVVNLVSNTSRVRIRPTHWQPLPQEPS